MNIIIIKRFFIILIISIPLANFANDSQKNTKNDPNFISLEQLFIKGDNSKKLRVPQQAKKFIPLNEFATLLIKDIDRFREKDFITIKTSLLNSTNLDIGTLAILFIKSDNNKIKNVGFELLSETAINKSQFFKPNQFYMILAEMGFDAEAIIDNIIQKTKHDFVREWASELYVDIFYNNTTDKDSRHRKISNIIEEEKEIYYKLKTLFINPVKIEELIKSKQNLGKQIRQKWGSENRYTLKLLAIMKLLDNLTKKNQFATSVKILKILKTYNFNYNILNRLNGKPIEVAKVKNEIKLKYLANAIFANNTNNTFKWIDKKSGGFTKEDVSLAIKSKNQNKIKAMTSILKKIICKVLRGKLLLGLGNHELNLLRYFYSSNWNKDNLNQETKMITISNMSGAGAPLTLSQAPSNEDLLTGVNLNIDNAEEKSYNFYIPSHSTFVWFIPNGNYSLSVNKKNDAIRSDNLLYFKNKTFLIKNNNISFNLL